MKSWAEVRERIPVWGTYAVGSLVLATVVYEILEKTGLFSMLKIPNERIMEGLLVCSLTLGFFSIEQFSKTEKGVEELKVKTSDELQKTGAGLDALKKQVDSALSDTSKKVDDLRRHQVDAIELASFSGADEFRLHWTRLLERYDSLILWGNFGPDFTREFEVLQKRGKQCHYYVPIEEDSQDVASNFLLCAEDARKGALKLFETGASGDTSWVMGLNLPGDSAEALVCFSALDDVLLSGVHITGAKALRFHQCVAPRLEAKTDQHGLPVRIYTQKQIQTVVSAKLGFEQNLIDVDKGEILKGLEAVCEGMTSQLREVKQFIDMTHICSEETIPLFRSSEFAPWLEANYQAAANKIAVTRIFLRPRSLRSNQTLRDVISEMRHNDINVLVCDLEDLGKKFEEDFSIYDERHVIYIDRSGGGPWVPEDAILRPPDRWKKDIFARRSDSLDMVCKYRTLFNIIKKKAIQNGQTVPI